MESKQLSWSNFGAKKALERLGSKQLSSSHFRAKKCLQRLDLGKTSYKDLVFARCEFLWLVGAPNESLRLIIIYYMIKCTFGIKRTLIESLRSEKKITLMARIRQN